MSFAINRAIQNPLISTLKSYHQRRNVFLKTHSTRLLSMLYASKFSK